MATPGFEGLSFNLSYYYIGQFSRYIKPGACGVGNTRYGSAIESTACLNPDGTLVCVVMNPGDEDESCFLRVEGRLAEVSIPGRGISTFVFEAGELG
jgi:glucosylceramidase